MNDRCDMDLVVASRHGDKGAYAVLLERHYRHVFAVCLGMLGNLHDAEDIAQDAMLKGFTSLTQLRKSQQFSQWIVRIAKNLCVDFIRRRKTARAALARQASLDDPAASENHALTQAIGTLPKEIRLPLMMYYFDGRSTKSIAERLNISHSGVCQRIRTARQQLHRLLTMQGEA